MGGSSPSPAPAPSTTSTTQSTVPWNGAAQYLNNLNSTFDPSTGQYVNNGNGAMGAYQQAYNYNQQYNTLTPTQQALNTAQTTNLNNQQSQLGNVNNTVVGIGNNLANGTYNTNVSPVSSNSMATALGALGGADPTAALQSALSGQVNNPYLAQMAQSNTDQATNAFNADMLNMQQQVLPQIGNDAFAAGQYGGSRQGVAEGLAQQALTTQGQVLNTNANAANNQMYGQAYQNAQNNAVQTANSLASLAANNGQFNANLGLQNNTQTMAQAGQNAGNAVTGANALISGLNNNILQSGTLNTGLQQVAQMPQAQAQNSINAYLAAISPGASFGSTATTAGTATTPYYSNTLGQLGGLAAGTAGIVSALK